MNRYIIAIAISIAFLLTSCNDDSNTYDAEAPTIITGKIKVTDSTSGNSLSIRYYDYQMASMKVEEITPAVDGSFQASIDIEQPLEIMVAAYNVLPVIVVPGDSIYVNFDDLVDNSSFSQSIRFTGDRSEDNMMLRSYRDNMELGIDQFYKLELENGSQDLKQYLLEKRPVASYNDEFLDDDVSSLFKKYAQAEEKYFAPSTLIDYVNYRKYRGYPAPQSDEAFFDFIYDIPELEKEDLVNTEIVSRLIYNLSYYYQMLTALQTDSNELFDETRNDIKAVEYVVENSATPLLHSYVVHKMIMRNFDNHNVAVYEETKELLERFIVEESLLASLENKYQLENDLLAKPQLSTEAVIMEFDASSPKEFLKEIIEAADGKVIYIDNWATWCQPCIQEFKEASKNLHTDYKDDVYFVYLCHNSKRETYLPTIAQYDIKGHHYYLEDAESAMMQQALEIEGFPTYSIISKSGELVISDYIHRPSYGPTRTILDQLINE